MEYRDYTKRGVAIIIKDNDILLMHRIKEGREYYVFPGGSSEEDEDPKDTTIRELKEEFAIDIIIDQKLFELSNTLNCRTRQEYYYLVKSFTGTPMISGEEKDRMTDQNQYAPKWINLADLPNLPLFPEESKEKIITLFLEKEVQ